MKLSKLIAKDFHKTFLSKKSHQIDKGGRASTKTSKNALKIGYHTITEKNCSVIIIKRYSNTLRNSVYKEMKRALGRLGLVENIDYKANVSPMQIKILQTGNNIYFAGGDDYEKVKGFIDENRPIKIVWFEELTEFDSEETLQQINATFQRGNIDWFISMYSYNPPKNKFDWVNKWAEDMATRDDTLIIHTDYRSVPREWLGELFISEAERLKHYDTKRYNWMYLGEVIGVEGLIFNPDQIELVKEVPRIIYIDFSIDSGHQTSATVCGAYGMGIDNNVYRLDTYYYSPNEKSVKKAPSQLTKDLFNFQISVMKEYQAVKDKETIDSAERSIKKPVLFRLWYKT